MSVRVAWSAAAKRDLAEIEDFIALDDPVAAERWVLRLVQRAAQAAHTPQGARVFPPLARADVREVLLRRYRLVFQMRDPGSILVLRVLHGARTARAEDLPLFETDE